MNEGISAEEACRTGALTAEDFTRMCNVDGTLKNQSTTQTTRIDPNIDVNKYPSYDNNTAMVLGLFAVAVIVFAIFYALLKRIKK